MTDWFGTGHKRAGTLISQGKRTQDEFTPAEWEDFKKYCAEDVEQTAACAKQMLPYVTGEALVFSNITCKMATEPAFLINPAPLHEYLANLDAQEQASLEQIKKLFIVHSVEELMRAIRSADTFTKMLKQLGVVPPMKISEKKTEAARKKWQAEMQHCDPVRRETIKQLLADPANYTVYTPALAKQDLEFLELLDHPNPAVRTLVQMRLDHNSSVPRARGLNLLRLAESGRPLPIMLKAYYAHTSRYGAGTTEGKSDGTQVQNIPKHRKDMRPLRQSIVVPASYCVVACDSSQIEARVLAYEAQELELLAHFREGRDPYAEMASKFDSDMSADEIHNGAKSGDKYAKMLRQIGKKMILSAGFGVGSTKVGLTLLREGVKLHEDKDQHMEIAKDYHRIYKTSNPHIVGFWKKCGKVLDAMAAGSAGFFGGPNEDLFEYGLMPICDKVTVPSIKLPTGFILRYPNLRYEDDQYVYDRPFGKNIVKTRIYGSAITENLTQALAFQILMHQACCMAARGIEIKVNIHDSFATVVPESQAKAVETIMLEEMRRVPEWVAGLPLDAEAEIGHDFTIV